MGYKVQYGVNRHERRNRRALLRKWVIAILLDVILVTAWVMDMRGTLYEALLPGDPVVTASALENLRQDLASGEPLGEAVTAFCREVIDGAALAE